MPRRKKKKQEEIAVDTSNIARVCTRGPVEDWSTRIIKSYGRDCYIVRAELVFSDGSKTSREYSMQTRREASAKEKEVMEQLFDRTFVTTRIRTEEFFRYWLDTYMVGKRNISYSTWYTYNRFIRRNIMPVIKGKWMEDVTEADITQILDQATAGTVRVLSGALSLAFQYAKSLNLIRGNHAQSAIAKKQKRELRRKADEAARAAKGSETGGRRKENGKRMYTLSVKQTGGLLLMAREKHAWLFLPLLLACTTGCRISEICAIRYQDVDFSLRAIRISGQIGRDFGSDVLAKGEGRMIQRTQTKTQNAVRVVPVPDFVLDEIAAERSRFQDTRPTEEKEIGAVTVWHREDGRPYHRRSYQNEFRKLKAEFGLPEDFHWHDLRHAYATIMVDHQANLKEVASVLGHASGRFTMEHYVVAAVAVREGVAEYRQLFEEVMPFTVRNGEIMEKEKRICEVDGFTNLMQGLIVSVMEDATKPEKKKRIKPIDQSTKKPHKTV